MYISLPSPLHFSLLNSSPSQSPPHPPLSSSSSYPPLLPILLSFYSSSLLHLFLLPLLIILILPPHQPYHLPHPPPHHYPPHHLYHPYYPCHPTHHHHPPLPPIYPPPLPPPPLLFLLLSSSSSSLSLYALWFVVIVDQGSSVSRPWRQWREGLLIKSGWRLFLRVMWHREWQRLARDLSGVPATPGVPGLTMDGHARANSCGTENRLAARQNNSRSLHMPASLSNWQCRDKSLLLRCPGFFI